MVHIVVQDDAAASAVAEDRTAVVEDHTVAEVEVEEARIAAVVVGDRIAAAASVVEDRTVVLAYAGYGVDRSRASARQSAS